ncbi:MAG: hypothetical protein C9356_13745 [Oleiphilus sp.]|nr:MAG: hypothetical protein C9356_13745 [Oleiphilus sp.]
MPNFFFFIINDLEFYAPHIDGKEFPERKGLAGFGKTGRLAESGPAVSPRVMVSLERWPARATK